MKPYLILSALLLLCACETAFETHPPRIVQDNVFIHRSPATEQNVVYSLIDSATRQMSEGPPQKYLPYEQR